MKTNFWRSEKVQLCAVEETDLVVRMLEQLHNNLSSMDVSLIPEQLQTLNEASALESAQFFAAGLKRIVFVGLNVKGWR